MLGVYPSRPPERKKKEGKEEPHYHKGECRVIGLVVPQALNGLFLPKERDLSLLPVIINTNR
jgi:cytochrome oxidase assembly protein ShyY1